LCLSRLRTLGWTNHIRHLRLGPMTEVEGLRLWRAGAATIDLRCFDVPPDFERLKPEYLRETFP